MVTSKPIALSAILPRYLAVCSGLFFAAAGLALFMGRWLAGRVIDPVNRLCENHARRHRQRRLFPARFASSGPRTNSAC